MVFLSRVVTRGRTWLVIPSLPDLAVRAPGLLSAGSILQPSKWSRIQITRRLRYLVTKDVISCGLLHIKTLTWGLLRCFLSPNVRDFSFVQSSSILVTRPILQFR